MVSRRTDRLFHKMTHHTNISQPFSKYLSGLKYPSQPGTELGRPVTLKYRNKYLPNISHISDSSPDKQQFDPTPYEGDDFVGDIIEQEFILLRCDQTEPYVMIAITDDYIGMVVGDSRNYKDIIYEYPKQIEEYLGLAVINQYYETPDVQLKAVVLSCDSMEPCQSIIAEFYSGYDPSGHEYRNDYVRFVLESEVQSVVMDRYDADGLRDYNGKDAEGNIGLLYIDLNGWRPGNEGETITRDANGGYPDPLQDLYRTNILSREEVLELRGRILTERRIYGCEYIYPESITIDQTELYIVPRQGVQLHATVLPEGAIGRVFWKSSDSSIVSVNNNGVVVGKVLGGSATITATTEFGGLKATCNVTVIIAVTGIDFDHTGEIIDLEQDETFEIIAKAKPDNATVPDLTYTSDNEWIEIDENHIVKLKEGYELDEGYEATITIASVSNPEVLVTFGINYLPSIIHPTNVILATGFKGPYHDNNSDNDFYFFVPSRNNYVPEIYYNPISFKIEPENVTETRLHWKVTDPWGQETTEAKIVSTPVDEIGPYTEGKLGYLPGLEITRCENTGQGTRNISKIIATGDRDIFNDIFVARGNPITALKWVDPGKKIKGHDKGTFRVKVDRLNNGFPCTEKGITFTSSDPNILKLGTDGEIYYKDNYPNYFTVSFEAVNLGGGHVTITAETTEDFFGSFTTIMELDIESGYIPVESISFKQPGNTNVWTNRDGQEYAILEMSYVPSDATYKEVSFSKIDGDIPDTITLEIIDEYSCKVIANKYDGGAFSQIKAISVDNPSVTAIKNVYSNTECKQITMQDEINIDPFGDTYTMNINFLSDGHGGVNREFITQALDSAVIEDNNCNLTYEFIDDWEGTWTTVKVKFTTQDPGSAKFKIRDEHNMTWVETSIKVGEDISEINILGDSIDWSSHDIGDIILIPIAVNPDYWYKLQDDSIVVVEKPQFVTVDSIYYDEDDETGYIKIHMNNIIIRDERITIQSTKKGITASYTFTSQVGTVKIANITPTFNDNINTYHATYSIPFDIDPDEFYDTLPTVKWTVNENNIITLDNDYEVIKNELITTIVNGEIPFTVITDKAALITLHYEAQDEDHINGYIDLNVGKPMLEYTLSVTESDYVEFDDNVSLISVKGPAIFSIEAYTEDTDVLNGLIDFNYDLPSFVESFEYHDDITYKPTTNLLQLDFYNLDTIGSTEIKILPQDGINNSRIINIEYGNSITDMWFNVEDMLVDRSIIVEKDGIYYIDLIAGSDQSNLPIKIRTNIETKYDGFEPTIWDTIWSIESDQFEQYIDDINLTNEDSKYYIENDGIRYKNSNKEASQAIITVRTSNDTFYDNITISTMGINIKETAPVTYVDGEYVYDELLAANSSINTNELFDFIPSEDYISIQDVRVTSDLAEMIDYTLDHGIFKITHIKSYDYDESKPIGINVVAQSYLLPDQEVTMFIRLKLVDMNHMVNFGYDNNSYTEEMYTVTYNPDSTNNYYSNNIKLTMEGQDKLAIPDDYKISDIIFGSENPAITTFSSYDNIPIGHKDYKISYKLNKPGSTTIDAKTPDNVFNTIALLNIYGVIFAQRTLDTYTESTYDLSTLIIHNGTPSYGVVVYDIDSTLSDPNVVTIDHYSGEITMDETVGNVYVKAYFENYPRLYDYIKIQVTVAPTEECTDIEIISSVSSEVDEIIIRDETDLRTVTFKQKGINGNYLKPDIQLYEVSIIDVGTAISYINHPGTRPSNYQYISITTETPLLNTGIGTITAVSWDQNITKTLPIKFGNKIISATFPAEYSDFKINIANEPYLKQFKLKVTPEYPGYKPSTLCTWSSSNPNILSVDPNGTIEKDSTDGNKYNFFTTYTLHAPEIGNVTITATTSYGSYSFDIVVYNSDAPIARDMLNIHEIDMVYTNDSLEHQLSVINPPTETYRVTWSSDKVGVATVSDDGLVNIIDVPDENEFTYYDDHGNPLEEVSLDFYINVSVQTEMAKYIDKCLVHIVGESKIIPTAKLIHEEEMIVKTGTENIMEFIGTPYYIKNNDTSDTITFTNLNYDITPDPFTLNNFKYPITFDDDGIARVSFNVGDYNFVKNIIDEEYDYEELPNDILKGDYDFDDNDTPEYNPEPYVVDVDFEEVSDSESKYVGPKDTPYDQDVLTRKYRVHLNNPKNIYGAGVIDSEFNICIDIDGSVDPDPDPEPDPDPYDPSIFDNPLAEFFITTSANYDQYSDTMLPLNPGQTLIGYYGKSSDYYDPDFMNYFGDGSSASDDDLIIAIVGQDPYMQCDEYDLSNDHDCVTFLSDNHSIIKYPEDGESPQGWKYFLTYYCKTGLGDATVTIRTSDNRHTSTANIRVLGIKFIENEISINIGDTIDLRDYTESNEYSVNNAIFERYSDQYTDFDINRITLNNTIVTGVSSGKACIRMTYETEFESLYNFLVINVN